MKIYDFESADRLEAIKEHHKKVKQIKDSLSENRVKYRNLSFDINIDQDSIFECCGRFEESLLINCYTYAEQLFKNFYYQIINKGSHTNAFLNTFIDTKIHPNKFSPNVLYEEIENTIKKELCNEFKFTISKEIDEVKKYNQLVKSRHRYAHSGIFFYDFENYDDVIDVLEYLKYEVISLLFTNDAVNTKKNLHGKIYTLYELSNSLLKIPNTIRKNFEIKKLKDTAKEVEKGYYIEFINVPFLSKIICDIKSMADADLRKYKDSHSRSCKLFESLDNYVSKKVLVK